VFDVSISKDALQHRRRRSQRTWERAMYYTWNYSWYYNPCTGYYSWYYTWNYWY
jgi:capsule polysaccharide export protein KpsC/LpsZ